MQSKRIQRKHKRSHKMMMIAMKWIIEDGEEKDGNQPGASSDIRPRDYVKIIQGDFVGYYACAEENTFNNMFHIQYFKSQFGKYVVNEGDTDIRDKDDLRVVSGKIDRRSWFTFSC